MRTREDIAYALEWVERKRKNLDGELDIYIHTHDHRYVLLVDTSYGSPYIARTMEYIQGLKHDTDTIIEKLKKELEEYETDTKTNH